MATAETPFEHERTLLFTFGGTANDALAFVVMLWLRVPPGVRVRRGRRQDSSARSTRPASPERIVSTLASIA
jgi:hypothetical protein